MTRTAVLIGGPRDGVVVELRILEYVLRIPYVEGLDPLDPPPDDGPPSTSLSTLDYVLAMYLGRPSKDNHGRLRYVFEGHQ